MTYSLKDVHFVIASVPWREDCLKRIIETACKAGLEKITVILDGYTYIPIYLAKPMIKYLECRGIIRGFGARWYAGAESDRPITQVLDDDLWVNPDYWQWALDKFLAIGADVLTLGGWDENAKYHDIGNPAPEQLTMRTSQNNAVTLWTDILKGMVSDPKLGPLLPTFYSAPGEDEGPLSCYCWMNKRKIIRPEGYPPVTYDAPLSQDKRSMWQSQLMQSIYPLRTILKNKFGWTDRGIVERAQNAMEQGGGPFMPANVPMSKTEFACVKCGGKLYWYREHNQMRCANYDKEPGHSYMYTLDQSDVKKAYDRITE